MRITCRDIWDSYPGADLLNCSRPRADVNRDAYRQETEHCGDTLFHFLICELVPDDNDDFDYAETQRRLANAMGDLGTIQHRLRELHGKHMAAKRAKRGEKA